MKKQVSIYVLRDAVNKKFLLTIKVDALVSTKGMQAVYQNVLTSIKKDAMRVQGSLEFARGYAHGINFLLNTNFQPEELL